MLNNIKKLATGHGLVLRTNEESSILIEPAAFAKFQEHELSNPQMVKGGTDTALYSNDEFDKMLREGSAILLSNEELLRLTEVTSRISLLQIVTDIVIGRFSYSSGHQQWAVNN
jgi:hypothetical protein